jgi:hypothetical protein
MGVPTSEVGYTSATTGRGDHEVHKGHVVALEKMLIYSYTVKKHPELPFVAAIYHTAKF